jgi:methylase of polypeptide subunit release factors
VAEMNNRAQRAQSIVGYSAQRAEHDFYPTPEYVTRDLLARERFIGNIWEPACGDGAIAKVFVEHGFDVIATDLVNRGYGEHGKDFLQENRRVNNIVTNPPYSLGEKFVRHSLSQTDGKVAMFLKLVFLEGLSRRQMFESSPLARVWVYSKRVTQHRNGESKQYSGMMCFAWFVWEHGYIGEPVIKWI